MLYYYYYYTDNSLLINVIITIERLQFSDPNKVKRIFIDTMLCCVGLQDPSTFVRMYVCKGYYLLAEPYDRVMQLN